jgi:large subunit ribosomal protein L21
MYAVFEDGSRQFRVSEGEVVRVDFRRNPAKEEREGIERGSRLEFSRVLLYANGDKLEIGRPTVEGAKILAQVVSHPSIKTVIGKFRRRKGYRRKTGHRQFYTAVKIHQILLKGDVERPLEPLPEKAKDGNASTQASEPAAVQTPAPVTA